MYGCSVEMLDLVASVLKFCGRPESEWFLVDSAQRLGEYIDLKNTLQGIKQTLSSPWDVDKHYALDVAELYRLAALIYLIRCHEGMVDDSEALSSYVNDAFDVLSHFDICERPYPLIIVGCEAHSDSQRRLVLDLLANTEATTKVRSYTCIKRTVEYFWNLQDLDEAGETPYINKMTSVISSNAFFPSFM
jgi:hypothetical protein